MKKILSIVTALFLCFTMTSCAPRARMDAYVKAAHPNAWEIKQIGVGDTQIYVLCDGGKVRLVRTDRSSFSADIMEDIELSADHVSCK